MNALAAPLRLVPRGSLRVVVLLLALLLGPEGAPLFYWGARLAVVVAEARPRSGESARVIEVHGARDGASLVVRLTLDRPVRDALFLPDHTPVSGRLQAVLYVDTDDDRSTGLAQGDRDLRTGADRRIDLATLFVGEDPAEKRQATILVTVLLSAVGKDGRRRSLWRSDDAQRPRRVAVSGEWVEIKLPADRVDAGPNARLILSTSDGTWDGRLPPER